MKTSTLVATALATVILLGPVSATAQQHKRSGPGMMDQGMMGQMMGGNCPMRGMMMGDAEDTFSAGRIAFLKAELEITEKQLKLFDVYSTSLRSNLQGMHSMRQNMMSMMEAESPVERLNTHLKMMESRLESLKSLKEPLEALYAALSDEQKTKANTLLTRMGCMR